MDQAPVFPTRHRLDSDTYFRMGEAGVFDHELRIELIDGELYDMAPIGQWHASSVNRLNETLVFACTGRAIVSVQNSVQLDRFSAPQPDFALLRPRADYYGSGRLPGPADVLLLIEVADSSLEWDRTVKLSLYASAGIVEYWIVDKTARVIVVHRAPSGNSYGEVNVVAFQGTLPLAADPAIVVDLARALG